MARARQKENGERLVTASEVAEIGNVRPSAVSNWRKRFPDFPKSVGTAPSGGDLFRLSDVERWLRTRPDRTERVSASNRLWGVANQLRGRSLAGDLVALVAMAGAFVHLARQQGEASVLRDGSADPISSVRGAIDRLASSHQELSLLFAPLADLESSAVRLLLETLAEFDGREDLAQAVDTFVARGSRYGEFRTSQGLLDLITDIAELGGVVFDPAAGPGEFLIRAGVNARRTTTLLGQELSVDAWRICLSRMILHGIEARIELGDSLLEDRFPSLRADTILCEPPAGTRWAGAKGTLSRDPRWELLGLLESPPPRATDFAWLAHVIQHLAPAGRGYVVLPPGSLVRSGIEARLRSELLRQGTLEAVITLPTAATHSSLAASALWIVQQPVPDPRPVLLVDGRDKDSTPADLHHRIATAVYEWRTRSDTFEPEAGFATSVPVLELLGGDVSLEPSRWLFEPDLVDRDSVIEAVTEAQRQLAASHENLPSQPARVNVQAVSDPPPRMRVRELVDRGFATVVRPARLKPDDYVDEGGVPVWLPADVRRPWEREEDRRGVNQASVKPESVTKPGDIVLTTIGEIRTRVDVEGGHVLGTSLQALRLEEGLFNTRAVAALLISEQNRRLVSGTIPRVNVLDLELPQLSRDEAGEMASALDALEDEEGAGHAIAQAAAVLREAIVEAVATGVVRVSKGSDRDD
jgi:hypothetical protein